MQVGSSSEFIFIRIRDGDSGEWQDWLVDGGDNHEDRLADHEEAYGRRLLLAGALKTLSERERQILSERRLQDNPTTLESLSQRYGISRERVRQIEVRAFEKLQKAIRNQAAKIAGQTVATLEAAKA